MHTHAHTDWQGNSEELNSTTTLQVLEGADKWLEGGGCRERQGTSRWQGDASPTTTLHCCPATSAQSRPPTAASRAWILWISDPACRRLQILTYEGKLISSSYAEMKICGPKSERFPAGGNSLCGSPGDRGRAGGWPGAAPEGPGGRCPPHILQLASPGTLGGLASNRVPRPFPPITHKSRQLQRALDSDRKLVLM